MTSNNPTPTVTLQTTLGEMLNIAVKDRQSHKIVRFDMGQGREVAFVAIAEDAYGYLSSLLTYQDCRDQHANRVANAVAESIRQHGLPDPDNPQPFNIVLSSDGEDTLPPDGDSND